MLTTTQRPAIFCTQVHRLARLRETGLIASEMILRGRFFSSVIYGAIRHSGGKRPTNGMPDAA